MSTANTVLTNVVKAGNALVGVGCYSAVVQKGNDYDKVIKIGTNMDDPWLGYYHWIVAKNQDNPFVPKIYSHREFEDYYITIMERLEPSTLTDEACSIRDHIIEGNIDKKELFDDFVGHGYNDRDCKYIVDLCEAIANHTDALLRMTKKHVNGKIIGRSSLKLTYMTAILWNEVTVLSLLPIRGVMSI